MTFRSAVRITLTFNQGVAGSRPARPTANFQLAVCLQGFLESRRQGISPRTYEFYQALLSPFVRSCELNPVSINAFLSRLTCTNGKNAYYRAIRAFCNWLHRQGYISDNPITRVDPPKVKKIILPSLTPEQVDYLIIEAETVRDKAIISLFADSGLRLTELLSIKPDHIDFGTNTIIIWGKGGKQRKAPFTRRTAELRLQAGGGLRLLSIVLCTQGSVGRIPLPPTVPYNRQNSRLFFSFVKETASRLAGWQNDN